MQDSCAEPEASVTEPITDLLNADKDSEAPTTEPEREQDKLRETQRFAESIVGSSPNLIYIYDLMDDRSVYINEQTVQVLGYTPAKIQAMGRAAAATLVHPEDQPKFVEHKNRIARAKDGEVVEWEYRAKSKDGQWRWFRSRDVVFRRTEDGRPKQYLGTAEDVTEQKCAQEERREAECALRKSEERLSLAFRAANDAIWDCDLVAGTVWWNEAYNNLFGERPTDTQSSWQWWIDHIHPEDRDRVLASIQTALDGDGDRWNADYRYQRADGAYAHVVDRAYIARDATGKPTRILGAMRDITKRKEAEEAIRRSEKKSQEQFAELNDLYRTAPVGLCLQDRDLRYVRINERLAAMNGKPVKEHIGQTLGEVIPEVARTQEPVYRRVIETGEPVLNLEVTASTPTWAGTALVSYSPVKSEKGKVLGVNTVVQDITERKRAEEALRESEARFRLMADTAPVMVWMSGVDKLCTYFNEPWLKFTGRPMEQEVGTGWAEGVHPDDLKRCLEIYSRAFDTRQEFQLEYRLRRHDGEHRWVLDNGVARFQKDGTFAGYIGSCVDITERKQAEEALRGNEASLRQNREALRALTAKLITAQEEEWRHLGRELHDAFGQKLAVLAMDVADCEQELPSGADSTRQKLQRLQEAIADLSRDVHDVSRRLHPAILHDLGLAKALRNECAAFSEKYGIPALFKHENASQEIRDDVSLCLYRVTQESLQNAGRHADASEVHVVLTTIDNEIVLSIEDLGKGFELERVRGQGGLGLVSIEERVRIVNGSFSITSVPEKGTTVEVRIPLGRRN